VLYTYKLSSLITLSIKNHTYHNIVDIKQSRFPLSSLRMLRPLNLLNDFDALLLLDIVILEEGIFVYNMHNIVEKHLNISIERKKERKKENLFIGEKQKDM
jgi:hypothetical protein